MREIGRSDERNWPLFWGAIQALLVAAANISKLLDPVLRGEKPELQSAAKARAKALRELLAVADDSPLLERNFRNHFEHFDMRIQEWALTTKRKDFVDGAVGAWEGDPPPNWDPIDLFRNFDPNRWAVTFRDQTCELRPIVNEARRIAEKAHELMRALWFERRPTPKS